MYFGPECELLLQRECEKDVHQVTLECFGFYITATEETKKRLPVNHEFFGNLKFIEPNNALTGDGRS